jgi:hypothetical protein
VTIGYLWREYPAQAYCCGKRLVRGDSVGMMGHDGQCHYLVRASLGHQLGHLLPDAVRPGDDLSFGQVGEPDAFWAGEITRSGLVEARGTVCLRSDQVR